MMQPSTYPTTSARPYELGMRSLVVSADDFGFTPAINRGVIDAFERGVVTAVSMMVDQPGSREAVRYARQAGAELDVGLHLNLSVGRPCTRARSLTDTRTGAYLPIATLVARACARRVRAEEAFTECMAQANRLRDVGLTVTHLDGHRHLHLLPGIWEGVVAAADDLGGLPVRIPRDRATGDHVTRRNMKRLLLDAVAARALRRAAPTVTPIHFVGAALQGDDRYRGRLRSLVGALPAGTSELMTHPGYRSGTLPGGDGYDAPRERELRVLVSPEVRDWLDEAGVTLCNFRTISTREHRGLGWVNTETRA